MCYTILIYEYFKKKNVNMPCPGLNQSREMSTRIYGIRTNAQAIWFKFIEVCN